jgi:polyisoprenoid-binding protein YceI
MSAPRTPSTACDPPGGSGLAWGGPARRPVCVVRRVLLALVAGSAVGAAQAAPQEFVIDPANTHVHWELKHFGTSTSRGRFDAISGGITLDREAHSGTASFTIATASISTGLAPFDGILRGPYLLDVQDQPNAYFVARNFGFEGDQLTTVSGDFTLRGTTRSLTLRALRFSCRMETDPAREVCGGDFETEFKRSTFGITHSLPFVADRVRILIQIEASRP